MAWHYGTYSCGHEGRTNIIGPTKNRQWKADRHFEKLCPECWEKKVAEDRAKANAEATEKAKEMELQELQGTEKQVAWANTLRQKFIDFVENRIDKLEKHIDTDISSETKEIYQDEAETLCKILSFVLEQKTSASWYIENRGCSTEDIFNKLKEESEQTDNATTQIEEADVLAEAIVYPKNCTEKCIAEIKVSDDAVKVTFERNDKFREIVKGLGYAWGNGAWEKKITETTGTSQCRAAELGNKLLNAGFPIQIIDEETLKNAVAGAYIHECKRWVYARTKGEYEGWLAIRWEDGTDIYQKARKLPGSKWSNPSVVVKAIYCAEVEEFAELYGFSFTKDAQGILLKAKNAKEKAAIVIPVAVKEEQKKDGLKDILKSGDDILDDLKD